MIVSLASIGLIPNSMSATKSDFQGYKSTFGPLEKVTTNDNGTVDWLLSGTWRSVLTGDPNGNAILYYQGPGPFTAVIEMMKPDGTDRHTHALTHSIVTNILQNPQNNSTTINCTSTISLLEAPAVDISTKIERSNNGNVLAVTIDPESVDYHFGKSPFIYAISANPEFIKDQQTGQ